MMLRHGQRTTFQERLDIAERAAAGQRDSEIAAALACSVWTVRKWRRRDQQRGRLGLTSQMGRPAIGPLSDSPANLRSTLLHMRHTHPGWGPDTLLAELRVDPCWADQPLPSRSRIAALLKSAKLTRRYQRHSALPEPRLQSDVGPHDEWELDAQGTMPVEGVGKVSLITIIDVVSRLKVECYPCLDTTNPPLEAYQLMLRRAFLTTGLPRRISLDHGTVFYDNTTPSPFPTRLHLWLLALGVEVRFTRCHFMPDNTPVVYGQAAPAVYGKSAPPRVGEAPEIRHTLPKTAGEREEWPTGGLHRWTSWNCCACCARARATASSPSGCTTTAAPWANTALGLRSTVC